jgi:bifunctional UDP-N-acetylglucosamine pyrophosphorylase/glucosamine-1-phosphate N-acetyltransferase
MTKPLAAIVMAAGEGKRFRSARPKVLHELCGRPLLAGALDAVTPLHPVKTVVVVGRGAEAVEAAARSLTKLPLLFALQKQQLGTADAARAGDDALKDFDGDVLVLSGDSPLITAKTLRALVNAHRKAGAAATVLTADLADPAGCGRVVRAGGAPGAIERIVEERDATAAEKAIVEVNSSMYVFDRKLLRSALTKVDRNNAQGEFYLTDAITILKDKGEKVIAFKTQDADEIEGANSRAQLAALEAKMRARTNARLMADGVTIVDPSQTYVDPTVKIGRDTIVHPLTFIHGATVIGAGCEIGPASRITDSRIDNGARVQFSVLVEARVGADANVGPYAYLRPGARLAKGSKVGTFVEVKNSTIGEKSKVPHLSYVGDATIGRDVNVGAATVAVNYDSESKVKSRTVIGDGAKIGSDTMLIAPVTVGKNAVTGAGSVVTKDVPAGTVVVGNPARPLRKSNIKGSAH